MKNVLIWLIFSTVLLHGEESLSDLALELDTDKGPQAHNYTEIYVHYFAPLRDKSIKFLEIGIGNGRSVLMWEQYFPNAEFHFIDNDPRILEMPKSKGTFYHLLDQGDRVSLEEFVENAGGDFDIIIDDGGHFMHQQIISFQTLFPHLKSGGLYVIEDLHTSYWTSFGGHGNYQDPQAGDGTTIEFLKNLVEDLNYTSGATGYGDWKRTPPDLWETLNEYQRHIRSIHFYKSLCFIERQ